MRTPSTTYLEIVASDGGRIARVGKLRHSHVRPCQKSQRSYLQRRGNHLDDLLLQWYNCQEGRDVMERNCVRVRGDPAAGKDETRYAQSISGDFRRGKFWTQPRDQVSGCRLWCVSSILAS